MKGHADAQQPTDRPWGLTRATALAEPTAADPPAAMAIDPDTQLTIYYDAGGQIVHAGPPV
ncbi:putative ATP-grasp-modified RiPP [Kribbella sp. NPDC059898]|uniref:putative ATP-grasp-modified RiPP n=1 Tax=Kribbella sp. NPDC059898 TaxID=3346995 RepID=UPI003654084D